jgi:hypothetical protein
MKNIQEMKKRIPCIIFTAMFSILLTVPVQADDVAYTVTSGEQVATDSISITGNTDTPDEVKGADVDASGGQESSLYVAGDVNVQQTDNGNATGIDVSAKENSSATVTVGGNVVVAADGSGSATGIDITAGNNNIADDNIAVDNIAVDNIADDNIAIDNSSADNSSVVVKVAGDVNGRDMASSVKIRTENGATVTVVAEGTLSAGTESAIVFAGNPNDISLVIWKAELSGTGEDKCFIKEISGSAGSETCTKTASSAALEAIVQYIIKVDTNQSISLATNGSYTALDGTVYNTAAEGDTVAVRLNVPSGYELMGAYSDAGRENPLGRDAAGNYYLIVPKGGGIYVNMLLVQKTDPDIKDRTEQSDTTELGTLFSAPTAVLPIVTGLSDVNLLLSFPDGSGMFALKYSDILQYIEKGAKFLVIKTAAGEVTIPIEELQSYLQAGCELTFVLKSDNSIGVSVNGSEIKSYQNIGSLEAEEHSLAEELVDKAIGRLADDSNADLSGVAETLAAIGAKDALDKLLEKAGESGASADTLAGIQDARDALDKQSGSKDQGLGGAGSSGMENIDADELLDKLEEVLGENLDQMDDNELAIAEVVMSEFAKSGMTSAEEVLTLITNKMVGDTDNKNSQGNKYIYKQNKQNKSIKYISLAAIANITDYNYFYDDNKSMATMTHGMRILIFTGGSDQVRKHSNKAETEKISAKTVFQDNMYIAEEDADTFFNCRAEYIYGTEYAVCLTSPMQTAVAEYVEKLKAAVTTATL